MSGIRSLFLSPVRSHLGTTASHPNLRHEANTFFVFAVSRQFCKDGRRIGPFLVVLRFHYFLAPPERKILSQSAIAPINPFDSVTKSERMASSCYNFSLQIH